MINTDILRERIRERLADSDSDTYCPFCDVQLTTADHEAEACTNCGLLLVSDQSADEDLWASNDFD